MSKSKTKASRGAKRKTAVHHEAVDPIPQSDVPDIQVNESAEPHVETSATEDPKPAKGKRGRRPATSAPKEKTSVPKALSCLAAAVAVLKAKGEPMRCQEMIDAMKEQKFWTSDAPTPAATLSSAILREMKKGEKSRFEKSSPGHFTLKA
jgi:hypothetical protein